jgi:hypothetical protein
MRTVRMLPIRADSVVSWHNPLLLEIVAHSIVPRVRTVFLVTAIS